MQRTYNVMAIRQFVPRSVDRTDLNWIYLGYADDPPELRRRRLKQLNLAGPAGFVSMEDGCIGNFVERGAAAAPHGVSLLEMGGAGTESQETRATETAIRGFLADVASLDRGIAPCPRPKRCSVSLPSMPPTPRVSTTTGWRIGPAFSSTSAVEDYLRRKSAGWQ